MSARIYYFLSTLILFIAPGISQTLSINYTETPITIDAIIETQWDQFEYESIDNNNAGIITSKEDLNGKFKVTSDQSNLYFLVVIEDDSTHSDQESQIWNDDGVEIFLDVGNDKQPSYGVDDFQYQLRYDDQEVHESKNNATTNIQFHQIADGNIVIYEIAIPHSTIGLEAIENDLLIGFDIHLNDDDNSGNREGKLAWYARDDQSSQKPAYFGIAKFDEFPDSPPSEIPNFSHERGFFNEAFELTISSNSSNAQILYTLDGSDPRFSETRLQTASPASVNIDPNSAENRGGKTPGVILRATVKSEEFSFSPVVTKTYFFTKAIINQDDPEGIWNDEHYDFSWPGYNSDQNIDYAMSSNITESETWGELIDDALLDIPSYSLVTKYEDMFDPDQGIFMNALTDGWERPVSVEMIDPKTGAHFQIDAGIRIRGRYSRLPRNAKHSFRLFFRKEYGDADLNYPVFDDEGTSSFRRLDFRTAQNSSWQTEESHETVTFLKEVFARDASGEMGMVYTKSRYCHLYLNGMYWGLFQIQERAEENFAKTYLGGNKNHYDIIKPEKDVVNPTNDLKVVAKEGTMESAERMWQKVLDGLDTNEAYFDIQGMNADGTRNFNKERLLDVDNLIDYLLIAFYTGSNDGPGVIWEALWGHTYRPNNFIGIYNRENPDGFKWIVHDMEKTMYTRSEDFPLTTTDDTWFSEEIQFMTPVKIHRELMKNTEYRLKLADRVFRHLENDGVLTPDRIQALFAERKSQIQLAVIAEAARWGDIISWMPANTPDNWENNVSYLTGTYIPDRTRIVLDQFESLGIIPSIDPPILKDGDDNVVGIQYEFNPSSSFALENPNESGTIYYTLDGSDPRLVGGAISEKAITGPELTINSNLTLKTRIKNDDEWSVLFEITLLKVTNVSDLKITEIHYNPTSFEGLDGENFEFLEFKNIGNEEISLTGLKLVDGVQFDFTNLTVQPNDFVIIVSNSQAFESRYGFEPDGQFVGRLRNSGERIALEDFNQNLIIEVNYDDVSPWPLAADGTGSSLVSVESNPTGDPNNPEYWRASTFFDGSPSLNDPSSSIPSIMVNEVLSNPVENDLDKIELYNPTNSAVNIGNWYLTDDRANRTKWQIPASTMIAADGYLVYDEGDFGSAFGLSSHGEEVFVYSADINGELTGYSQGAIFGENDEGVSFGIHTTSQGDISFVALASNSFGSVNSAPLIGPVVVSEIMYNSITGYAEYLKLTNIGDELVSLGKTDDNTDTWRIDGVNFQFSETANLEAGESIYVIESEYAIDQFRKEYGLSASIQVHNMLGSLDNGGEELSLLRPAPSYTNNDDEVVFEYILVENIDYDDETPWQSENEGSGGYLVRKESITFANDPESWIEEIISIPPVLNSDELTTEAGNDVTITFTDDAEWRAAISEIKINNKLVEASTYTIDEGSILLGGVNFEFMDEYEIVVLAEGYFASNTVQSILTGLPAPLGLEPENQLAIYPNPAADVLIVELKSPYATYTISDLSGKRWKSGSLIQGQNKIAVNSLPSGVFLISLTDGNEYFNEVVYIK